MSLRHWVQACVGLVCLLLVLRVCFVAAYVVPTGSMAPTLRGWHRVSPCPRCSYEVAVGWQPVSSREDRPGRGHCPNCGQEFSLASAPLIGGDRLLVDQNVFAWRSPRRWEMAVFVAPEALDPSHTLYVKRVVGLPGEAIRLWEGDVYANGELCRKDWTQVEQLWQLVLDMDYPPRPQGWSVRWLVDPPDDPRLPRPPLDSSPAIAPAEMVQGSQLYLSASQSPQDQRGLTYRQWDYDEQREVPLRAENAYNGAVRGRAFLPPVHDFAMECTVEVLQTWPSGELAVRLYDGADTIEAIVPLGGDTRRRCHLLAETHCQAVTTMLHPWVPGGRYRLGVSFCDRRAIVVVDGHTLLTQDLPPPRQPRAAVSRPLQLRVRGASVRIHHLRLFNDVYYTGDGQHATDQAVWLGADEYFVLGDNSGNSTDSRHWSYPGVPRSAFIGKPFVIHQPLRPAVLFWDGDRPRVVQRLDWSRVRWLR
ncbi:MAG: S26 family signal peptidase [Thermogemmata sp.]|nr:S26 family signal peptidase [Thermogemmata sp.]